MKSVVKAHECNALGKRYLLLPGDRAVPETWKVVLLAESKTLSFAEASKAGPGWLHACGQVLRACRRHRHPLNLLVSKLGVQEVARLLRTTPARVNRLRQYNCPPTLLEAYRLQAHVDVAEMARFAAEEDQYP